MGSQENIKVIYSKELYHTEVLFNQKSQNSKLGYKSLIMYLQNWIVKQKNGNTVCMSAAFFLEDEIAKVQLHENTSRFHSPLTIHQQLQATSHLNTPDGFQQRIV